MMRIVTETLALVELKQIASSLFGDMVKAVVDVERGLIALDAELHSDLEALLLREGSQQKDLWGINLYPEMQGEDFIEYDSMINIRPSQGNKIRGVDNLEIRKKIAEIISKRIRR